MMPLQKVPIGTNRCESTSMVFLHPMVQAKAPVGANKHFMMQWHSMMPKSTARRMGLFMHMHFAVLISTNRCASTLWFKNTKIAKLKNMRSNDFEGVNTSQKILPILALHLGV
jgi:hypothetical protein